MRLHGSGRLPVPVAEQPLHEARQEHRHGAAPPAHEVRHAAQQERQADRSHGHEPRRRLQPRQRDAHEGSGARHGRGREAQQAAATDEPAPRPRQELAGRADQRPHRQAPPDLGRARLERQEARRPRADHPPGAQPRRGRALHRRPAEPSKRTRQGDRGRTRLPHLSRSHSHRGAPDRAAPPQVRADLQDAEEGRREARKPLPGVGLHGGERAQPRGPHAPHPRRRLRNAGGHQPPGPQSRRPVAVRVRRHGHRLRAGPGRPHRPQGRGAHHGAVLPDQRVRAGRPLQPRQSGAAAADGRDERALRLQHPALGARPAPRRRRRARRCTATACSAERARSMPAT